MFQSHLEPVVQASHPLFSTLQPLVGNSVPITLTSWYVQHEALCRDPVLVVLTTVSLGNRGASALTCSSTPLYFERHLPSGESILLNGHRGVYTEVLFYISLWALFFQTKTWWLICWPHVSRSICLCRLHWKLTPGCGCPSVHTTSSPAATGSEWWRKGSESDSADKTELPIVINRVYRDPFLSPSNWIQALNHL